MSQTATDYPAFLNAYPSYASTTAIDELRAAEYRRLDAGEHIYVDYTGGGMYADKQLHLHQDLLQHHVFGNPHSANPTSLAATKLTEHARAYVLEFFKA